MSQRRRGMSGIVAAGVAVMVLAGCGSFGGDAADDPVPGAVPAVDVVAPTEDAVEPAAEEATPPTTKAPKPTRKPKPRPTKAKPTEDPNWHQAPACADHEGPKMSKARVKAALMAASRRQYWRTQAPDLRVPFNLIKAVAWNESGWQTDIVNCDGGYGLMQTMPETVTHMNERFGLSYDKLKYRDNAFIGANYLAWLTKYFGDKYFDERYDLSTRRCRSHADRCLLNLVISGYNAGFGAVDAAYAKRRVAQPAYVDTVRSLMKSCYCDRY